MQPSTGIEIFPLVAHQGGWDEILMVVGPLAVIGGLLYLANKRVNDRLAEAAEEAPSAGSAGEPKPESRS